MQACHIRYATLGFLVAYLTITLLFTFTVRSAFNRPIWIDEFLHYAFTGFDIPDMWHAIRLTIQDINHGQTGVMMLINAFFLKVLGGTHAAMRLPSVLATIALFISAVVLLWRLGLSVVFQILVIAAISTQTFLAIYATETRPYIFLACAVSLTLLYYATKPVFPRTEGFDRRTTNSLGYCAVLIGCSFHPYFIIYWAGIFLICSINSTLSNRRAPSFKELIEFADLKLVLFGTVVYVGVGYATWMNFRPSGLALDPFQWIPQEILLRKFIDTHLAFILTTIGYPLASLFFGSLVVIALVNRGFSATLSALYFPTLIFLLAIGTSGLITYVSYRSDYWILERQWIASSFLIPVATVLAVGQLCSALRTGFVRNVFILITIWATLRIGYLQMYGAATAIRKSYSSIPIEKKPLTPPNTLDLPIYDWVRMPDNRNTDKLAVQDMLNISAQFVNIAETQLASGGPVPNWVMRFYCTTSPIKTSVRLKRYCE